MNDQINSENREEMSEYTDNDTESLLNEQSESEMIRTDNCATTTENQEYMDNNGNGENYPDNAQTVFSPYNSDVVKEAQKLSENYNLNIGEEKEFNSSSVLISAASNVETEAGRLSSDAADLSISILPGDSDVLNIEGIKTGDNVTSCNGAESETYVETENMLTTIEDIVNAIAGFQEVHKIVEFMHNDEKHTPILQQMVDHYHSLINR